MALYIFDKDGTLVGGVNGRPANKPDEQFPLDHVVAKIAALRAAGHEVAIASNQGGASWGFINAMQADELVKDAAIKCGVPPENTVCCCYEPRGKFAHLYAHEAKRRKPEPGMLNELMSDLGFSRHDTIMVGDRESDKRAADLAGVRFVWAKDFFANDDVEDENFLPTDTLAKLRAGLDFEIDEE